VFENKVLSTVMGPRREEDNRLEKHVQWQATKFVLFTNYYSN